MSQHLAYRSVHRAANAVVFLAACMFCPHGLAQSELVIDGAPEVLEQNIRLLVAQPPEPENTRPFQRYMDSLPTQVINALSAYGYYAARVDVRTKEVKIPPPAPTRQERIAQRDGRTTTPNPHTAATPATDNPRTKTQIIIDITLNEPVRIIELSLDIETQRDGASSSRTETPQDSANTSRTETQQDSANASRTERQQDGASASQPDTPGNKVAEAHLDTTRQILDFAQSKKDISALLAIGKPFVSADYEAAKSLLLNRAQDLGYFDFEFTKTEVRVSRNKGTAQIALAAKPGQRYTFGDILFQQRTFSDSFMRRWVSFSPGDLYNSSLIGELTQNLQNSGYFSSVRVRPLVDRRYETTVPVVVDLTEIEHNKVALGIGFSTDTGVRGTVTWDKPLINSLGHSAAWAASVSRAEQTATFSYRIPRSKQPLFNYWGLEYGLKRAEIDDIQSRLNTVNFQRASRTPNGWTESLFVRWERETSVTSGVEDTTNLVLPGFSYSRSRSQGKPFLTWGQSISFQLMGGSRRALSSIDFLKTEARFRYLRTPYDKHTFIGTVQYGAIHASDNDRIPASQRFFVGGDRTVRGFAYRSLSPLDDDGVAIGGRFLEVLSAEYNYRFRDRWSGALFADAGRAFNSFDADYSVGTGIGLRWQSPVGAFRIDFAAPVSDNDTGNFRIHLSLGADL